MLYSIMRKYPWAVGNGRKHDDALGARLCNSRTAHWFFPPMIVRRLLQPCGRPRVAHARRHFALRGVLADRKDTHLDAAQSQAYDRSEVNEFTSSAMLVP
jgi:hypothetical protein